MITAESDEPGVEISVEAALHAVLLHLIRRGDWVLQQRAVGSVDLDYGGCRIERSDWNITTVDLHDQLRQARAITTHDIEAGVIWVNLETARVATLGSLPPGAYSNQPSA